MHRVSARARGFTLIELMVTVGLIGLALTLVFLRIDTFLPASRLQAACRKLVADIEDLRLASIMLYKRPVHLEYDLKNHGYRAYLPYEVDPEQKTILGPGMTELKPFQRLPENIAIADVRLGPGNTAQEQPDVVTVLINPDGSVTGHIVHFKDEYFEKENSVRVSSLTGFAEILDGRVEYEEIDQSSF